MISSAERSSTQGAGPSLPLELWEASDGAEASGGAEATGGAGAAGGAAAMEPARPLARAGRAVQFDEIIGHPRAREYLQRALVGGRLAHAYLFHGPEGVGKRAVAFALAAALVCSRRRPDGNACGSCPECVACRAGSHPDVRYVEPATEAGHLTIQQVRELRGWLGLSPARGRHKAAVLDRVERMTPEAANAFLKALEEPPPGSLVVLLTADAGSVLPTIRSRALPLHFGPVAAERIEAALVARGLPPEVARRRAALARGRPGRALEANNPEEEAFRQAREWLVRAMSAPPPELDQLAQRLERADPTQMDACLCAMIWLWRDVAVWSCTQQGIPQTTGEPWSGEGSGELLALARRLTPRRAAEGLERLLRARRMLQEYASRRLVLDWAWMSLRHLLKSGAPARG